MYLYYIICIQKQLEAAKDKHKLDNVRKIEELNNTIDGLNKEINEMKKSYSIIEEEKSVLESSNKSLNEEILNEVYICLLILLIE